MATGTDAGLLDEAQPQSVFKHAILKQYTIRYATMTASSLTPRRSVLVDGFAGRGRHDDGSAASAEHMMIAAQKAKTHTQIDLFLVEEKLKDYKVLDSVADEYRARGLTIETRRGDCADYFPEILELARGASLFWFLDPCGAIVPWSKLVATLTARASWPRTEALLNFSAGLTRRAGGQVNKGQLDEDGVVKLDGVCGGTWWRDIAMDAFVTSGSMDWEASANAVAMEYAKRLGSATGMGGAVAAVHRKAHHQPVYHLVFLTHNEHGYWAMGDSAAIARQEWLKVLGPSDDEAAGMLFSTADQQIADEHSTSVDAIKANLDKLLADGKPKAVVKHTLEVFDGVYGVARQTAYTKAVRDLVKDEHIERVTKGSKPHQDVLKLKSA